MGPDHDDLCLLSALAPRKEGPSLCAWDSDVFKSTTRTMATEIVTILGEDQDIDATAEILRESLRSLADREGLAWMEEYLGRPRENARPPVAWELEDSYFDIAGVIGYKVGEQHAVLLRVDDFYSEEATWEVVIEESEDGTESRLARHIYWGTWQDTCNPLFCWERPYRYFEHWMRYSCSSPTSWDREVFIEQFYRIVDSHRRRSYITDDDLRLSGLLKCVSYGGLEKTYNGSFQWELARVRTQSSNTAAAIAAGARGKDLWPALAQDFEGWMAMRPDIWPTEPSSPSLVSINLDGEGATIFHTVPPEVLVQILNLVSGWDLVSLLQLSRGVSGLVHPLLDEILWYHVHYGEFRWILPVPGVKGEVGRANDAVKGWYSNPGGLTSVFDSREFPFAEFISECVRSSSMRNRRRLWRIYKQYKALWEAMGLKVGIS